MDIVVELFIEVYFELMMLIIPEERLGKIHRIIAKVIAICVLLGVCALAFWGFHLILEQDRLIGILPLAIAIIISLAQMIFGIILHVKKR